MSWVIIVPRRCSKKRSVNTDIAGIACLSVTFEGKKATAQHCRRTQIDDRLLLRCHFFVTKNHFSRQKSSAQKYKHPFKYEYTRMASDYLLPSQILVAYFLAEKLWPRPVARMAPRCRAPPKLRHTTLFCRLVGGHACVYDLLPRSTRKGRMLFQ